MNAIRIAAVILALGYASSLPAADTPKTQSTKNENKDAVKAEPKADTKAAEPKDTDKAVEPKKTTERDSGHRERKADTPPAQTTPAPNMRPTDPLNPDPMRPGTPPTFPRNESSPQTPVKPTDPTAPTIVK